MTGDVILSGSTIYFLLVSEQRFYSLSSSNYPIVETVTTGAPGDGGNTEPICETRLSGMKVCHPQVSFLIAR
jgi:hypothetical protein